MDFLEAGRGRMFSNANAFGSSQSKALIQDPETKKLYLKNLYPTPQAQDT
jgi:hypothetical protein